MKKHLPKRNDFTLADVMTKEEMDNWINGVRLEIEKIKLKNKNARKHFSTLQRENFILRKAMEQIENDCAWNNPAWKIANDALDAVTEER